MAKQRILPFFIPMEGCPYKCIYCDQVAISGQESSPTAAQIQAALADFPAGADAQIAFYGGSFTCLSEARQLYYLEAAAAAIGSGKISGIRISTRPDAINAEICAFLAAHGVRTVELGIQSFDDEVLAASGRCYTAQVAKQACRDITAAGLCLGVQLMTGLPADTAEKSRLAVREAAELGAELLRIYPTLVLEGTALAQLYAAGKYQPQSLEEAVSCCRDMLALAIAHDLTIIRIGINPSPEVKEALVAGPYHEAFGGLVKEAVTWAQIQALLEGYQADKPAALVFARADIPLVFGHARQGMKKLAARYPALALMPDETLAGGELQLVIDGEKKISQQKEFCLAEAQGR